MQQSEKVQVVPQLKLLVAGFPLQQLGFDPRSVKFVVEDLARGRLSSEYFCFLYRFCFHQLICLH
jgi:hypothetical protein